MTMIKNDSEKDLQQRIVDALRENADNIDKKPRFQSGQKQFDVEDVSAALSGALSPLKCYIEQSKNNARSTQEPHHEVIEALIEYAETKIEKWQDCLENKSKLISFPNEKQGKETTRLKSRIMDLEAQEGKT